MSAFFCLLSTTSTILLSGEIAMARDEVCDFRKASTLIENKKSEILRTFRPGDPTKKSVGRWNLTMGRDLSGKAAFHTGMMVTTENTTPLVVQIAVDFNTCEVKVTSLNL